jgi:methionyl-tRNA formyltransferase
MKKEGLFVFFGSGEFAAKVYIALLKSGLRPDVVVTAPDAPQGRGMRFAPSPVKELALQHGMPRDRIITPQDVNHPAVLNVLKKFSPSLIFLTDYGKILGKEILELPKFGAWNLHPSLLPKYRGAAPLERAIMNGDKEVGFTFFIMDEGVDTGKILYQEKIEVGDKTRGELESIIAEKSIQVFPKIYNDFVNGKLKPKAQKGKGSYAKKIEDDELWIRWDETAFKVKRHIHALSPTPGARTHFDGRFMKIYRAKEVNDFSGLPGKIIIEGSKLFVCCGEGAVEVLELQPAGKRVMKASEYVQGYQPFWAE